MTSTPTEGMTPHQQRAAHARAVRIRRADEKYADRLRGHGWQCVAPEDVDPAEDGTGRGDR